MTDTNVNNVAGSADSMNLNGTSKKGYPVVKNSLYNGVSDMGKTQKAVKTEIYFDEVLKGFRRISVRAKKVQKHANKSTSL